ncbi:MAG: hypothetical protein IPO25_23040 [Saprospiraceae bacterium]|nr:hypothetical protein [Saprospiraceae bacterium]
MSRKIDDNIDKLIKTNLSVFFEGAAVQKGNSQMASRATIPAAYIRYQGCP